MRILLLLFCFIPSFSWADTVNALTVGKNSEMSAWLTVKKTGAKRIHLAGYKSQRNDGVEIVVPASEYKLRLRSFSSLARKIHKDHKATPFCTNSANIIANNKASELCLDDLNPGLKRSITRWLESQRDLVTLE